MKVYYNTMTNKCKTLQKLTRCQTVRYRQYNNTNVGNFVVIHKHILSNCATNITPGNITNTVVAV